MAEKSKDEIQEKIWGRKTDRSSNNTETTGSNSS